MLGVPLVFGVVIEDDLARPNAQVILAGLSKACLAEVAREFGLRLPERASREEQARALVETASSISDSQPTGTTMHAADWRSAGVDSRDPVVTPVAAESSD
jgi:hypothetical protein